MCGKFDDLRFATAFVACCWVCWVRLIIYSCLDFVGYFFAVFNFIALLLVLILYWFGGLFVCSFWLLGWTWLFACNWKICLCCWIVRLLVCLFGVFIVFEFACGNVTVWFRFWLILFDRVMSVGLIGLLSGWMVYLSVDLSCIGWVGLFGLLCFVLFCLYLINLLLRLFRCLTGDWIGLDGGFCLWLLLLVVWLIVLLGSLCWFVLVYIIVLCLWFRLFRLGDFVCWLFCGFTFPLAFVFVIFWLFCC